MKILFFWLIFASNAFCSTYYVDLSGGDDTANGTSRSTPWRNIPGTCTTASSTNSSCTEVSNSWPTINAGDIILIKPGSTHSSTDGGRINLSGARYGSSTYINPITFRRDINWPSASGSVTFDGAGVSFPDGGYGFFHINARGGFTFDGVSGVSNAYDGIIIQNTYSGGIVQYETSTQREGLTIQYVKFHNNGTIYASTDTYSVAQLRLLGVTTSIISYCEFSGNGNHVLGLTFGESGIRSTGVTVSNCVSHNHGVSAGNENESIGVGFKAQNSQITWRNCTSYSDNKGWDVGENDGVTSWDITYSVINGESYNNNFGINMNAKGYEGAYSGAVNFYIINSIMRDNAQMGMNIYAGPYNLYLIHNIYDNNDINANITPDGNNDLSTMRVYSYNNVFYKPISANLYAKYWSDTTSDYAMSANYNSYVQRSSENFAEWDAYQSVCIFAYGTNGPGHASGNWYNYKGCDTGSVGAGHYHADANSKGTEATDTTLPPFTDVANHNYTLTTHYAGINLSAQPWYISQMGLDRNGNARTAWDIGAYEYGSTPGIASGISITGGSLQ